MLLAGMDVSGDDKSGNYKYLAVIIGTEESINRLSDDIGYLPTHISRLGGRKQNEIIGKMVFDGKSRIAFCIYLKRDEIVDFVKNKRKAKKKRMPIAKIRRTYNYVVMYEVKKFLEKFLLDHNLSITDLLIQCESDCIPFARAGSLKYEYSKAKVYRIADITAYCNNKKLRIPNVNEKNFTKEIPKIMLKMLNIK